MTTAVPTYADINNFIHNAFTGYLQGIKSAVNKYHGAILNVQHPEKGVTALFMATSAYKNNIVKHLISNGANLDIKATDSGRTPLIQGVIQNNVDGVLMLITSGANLNLTDKRGHTAIMYSLKQVHYPHGSQMFVGLLNGGANVLIKDSLGNKLLDYAKGISLNPELKEQVIQMILDAEQRQKNALPDVTEQRGGRRKTRRTRRRA